MSNRYIYKLIIVVSLWSAVVFAGATGPGGNPPAAPPAAVISINRYLTFEHRCLFRSLIQAIEEGDEVSVRAIFEQEQALDCMHLPGVTVNDVDINAIGLAVILKKLEILRFLLTYARDNHILPAINLQRARLIALQRGNLEAFRLIEQFMGVEPAWICALQ